MSTKSRTTLLLNWYANPYHTPIFVAKVLGFYEQEGINLAILEPSDPGDVTEIVGLGTVDIGVKAMIHTIAARVKGFPVVSIGTLLDEPPTGLITAKTSGITTFQDIVGKRIGYIGEFGKVIIEDLATHAGIDPKSFKMVRVGMNVVDAIRRDVIDAGIGFINFQQVELEALYGETTMLRIDQLAGLGCCCFCSIQFIVHESVLKQQPEMIEGFMRATQRGAQMTTENPEEAYRQMCIAKPHLGSELYRKIFGRTLPFFSRNLLNVERDWDKVGKYCKHLKIVSETFDSLECYTNVYVPNRPYAEGKPIVQCV